MNDSMTARIADLEARVARMGAELVDARDSLEMANGLVDTFGRERDDYKKTAWESQNDNARLRAELTSLRKVDQEVVTLRADLACAIEHAQRANKVVEDAEAEAQKAQDAYTGLCADLQKLGEEFGVLPGERHVAGLRRVLTELRGKTERIDEMEDSLRAAQEAHDALYWAEDDK